MSELFGFYCGICRYALDHLIAVDDGSVTFEHSGAWLVEWDGEPHEPLPVPLAEMLGVNMLCDVCSAGDPVWIYTFVPVEVMSTRGRETISAEWVLCDPCAVAVESRSIEAMIRCASLAWTRKDREVPDLPEFLGPVYEQLLASPFTRVPRAEVGV